MPTENWEERFEELVRPYGRESYLMAVPNISGDAKMWVMEKMDAAVKAFIANEKELSRREGRNEACDYLWTNCAGNYAGDGLNVFHEDLEAARNLPE